MCVCECLWFVCAVWAKKCELHPLRAHTQGYIYQPHPHRIQTPSGMLTPSVSVCHKIPSLRFRITKKCVHWPQSVCVRACVCVRSYPGSLIVYQHNTYFMMFIHTNIHIPYRLCKNKTDPRSLVSACVWDAREQTYSSCVCHRLSLSQFVPSQEVLAYRVLFVSIVLSHAWRTRHISIYIYTLDACPSGCIGSEKSARQASSPSPPSL